MSIEENKAIVRSYIVPPQGWDELNRQIQSAEDQAAFIEKDTREIISKVFAPECILHYPQGDVGYEDFIKTNIALLSAFRDISYSVEDMVAEGDRVVVRYSMRGTHQAPFMGIPATGKVVKGGGIMICQLAGGKIVEVWGMVDNQGMMQQLGVVPKQ